MKQQGLLTRVFLMNRALFVLLILLSQAVWATEYDTEEIRETVNNNFVTCTSAVRIQH